MQQRKIFKYIKRYINKITRHRDKIDFQLRKTAPNNLRGQRRNRKFRSSNVHVGKTPKNCHMALELEFQSGLKTAGG